MLEKKERYQNNISLEAKHPEEKSPEAKMDAKLYHLHIFSHIFLLKVAINNGGKIFVYLFPSILLSFWLDCDDRKVKG
jgi:hypothetical protein